MEIREINDLGMPDLLEPFAKVESADGDIKTGQWAQIQRGFAMYRGEIACRSGA
jgi:hypothetical protein